MTRGGALAAAVALVGASGCCRCEAPDFIVRRGAALSPAPMPAPPAGPVVRALHAGDFGDRTCQQDAVGAAILDAQRRAPLDVAIFAGDNLYDCGPDAAVPGAGACRFADDANTLAPGFAPPPDPTFGKHDDPLAPLAAGTPAPRVYLALGNHDVATCGAPDPTTVQRVKACLEVAHVSPVWTMPGRHYLVDAGPARFIVVDSNLVRGDYGGFSFDDEVAFVAAAGAECDRRTCFIVGHHPPAMAGIHRDDSGMDRQVERSRRLLAAAGGRIRAWLGGHDHDLQHLRMPEGVDVLVSGNGAGGRPTEKFQDVSLAGAELLFASVRWGYGILEVGADGWRYRFEGTDGSPLYCCAASGAGPCEPVSCR